MSEITFKSYIRYVYVFAFFGFILNRFMIRPWVLNSDLPEIFTILVYSLPNFFEAIIGTLLLSGLGLVLRSRFKGRLSEVIDNSVYLIATCIAGVYVLLQEFGLHNLGGNNTFDQNDVAASLLGLVVTYLMLNRFGLAVTTEIRS